MWQTAACSCSCTALPFSCRMTVFNYWTVAKSKLCTSAAGVLSPDFQTWMVKCTEAMRTAFSAQLTEQGQAQGCQEKGEVKRNSMGGGGGCRVHLPPSPPTLRLQLYVLQEWSCLSLSFEHSLDLFPLPPPPLILQTIWDLDLIVLILIDSPPLSPIRVRWKPGLLNVRMCLS